MRHRKLFISISLCRLLSVCHVSLSQRSDLPRERMCSWTVLAEKVAATASQAVLQDGLNSFLFLYLKCSKLPLNLLCYTASPTKHSLSRCNYDRYGLSISYPVQECISLSLSIFMLLYPTLPFSFCFSFLSFSVNVCIYLFKKFFICFTPSSIYRCLL